MRDVRLNIAKAVFCLKNRGLPTAIPDLYLPFETPVAPETDDAEYGLHASLWADASSLPLPCTRLWSGDAWRMGRLPDARLLVEGCDRLTGRWTVTAVAAPDFRCAELYPTRLGTGDDPPYAFGYPTARVVLINRLAFLSAVCLHASGVVINGRACVFCGRSEVGKTTLARLCRVHEGAKILNDDRMVLRLLAGEAWAASPPWHGKEPEVRTDIVRLGALFLLGQAPENRVRELGGAEAVAGLLANGEVPFYHREAMGLIMDAATQVASAVPSYRLDFRPDAEAVGLVRACLGA